MASEKFLVTIKYSHLGTQPPIYVAGSYSNPEWRPEEMQYTTDERNEHEFSREVEVEKGKEYQYKLRIGTGDWWVLDERAPTVTDDVGNRNNLLSIPHHQEQEENTEETGNSLPFLPLADEAPLFQNPSEHQPEVGPLTHLAPEIQRSRQYDGSVDDQEIESLVPVESTSLTPNNVSTQPDQTPQSETPTEKGYMKEKGLNTRDDLAGHNDNDQSTRSTSTREGDGLSIQNERLAENVSKEVEGDSPEEIGSNLTIDQTQNTEKGSDQLSIESTNLNPVTQLDQMSFVFVSPEDAATASDPSTEAEAKDSENDGFDHTMAETVSSRGSDAANMVEYDDTEVRRDSDEIGDHTKDNNEGYVQSTPQGNGVGTNFTVGYQAFESKAETDEAGDTTGNLANVKPLKSLETDASTRISGEHHDNHAELKNNEDDNSEMTQGNSDSKKEDKQTSTNKSNTNSNGLEKQANTSDAIEVDISAQQSLDGTVSATTPLAVTPFVVSDRQLGNDVGTREIFTGEQVPNIIVEPATPGPGSILTNGSSKQLGDATSTAITDGDATSQMTKRSNQRSPASERAHTPNSVRTLGRDPRPKNFFKVFLHLVFVDWIGKLFRKFWTSLKRQPSNEKLSVVVVVLIAVVAYLRLYGYESMVPRAVHDAFDSNRL